MPTRLRPWTAQLLRFIDEGITEREELIRLVTPYVPQGHAFRVREQTCVWQKAKRPRVTDRVTPRHERTLQELHRIGARIVIRDSLNSLVQNGKLKRTGDHFRRAAA